MTELLANDLIFHFNKKHLEDPSIPMWSIKARGRTFYVNHVTCELPWSTKESPDNSHTKGSIKIRKCLLRIDEDNCATILKPTTKDINRLRYKKPPIRILYNKQFEQDVSRAIANHQIKQGKILKIKGTCGSDFYITEFYQDTDLTVLTLALPIHAIRILNSYEEYYRIYDETQEEEIWDPYEHEPDDEDED